MLGFGHRAPKLTATTYPRVHLLFIGIYSSTWSSVGERILAVPRRSTKYSVLRRWWNAHPLLLLNWGMKRTYEQAAPTALKKCTPNKSTPPSSERGGPSISQPLAFEHWPSTSFSVLTPARTCTSRLGMETPFHAAASSRPPCSLPAAVRLPQTAVWDVIWGVRFVLRYKCGVGTTRRFSALFVHRSSRAVNVGL